MKKLLSILFSRYTLCILLIFIELSGLIVLALFLNAYSIYFVIISAICDLLILIAIINSDMNPEYRMTWMGVVLLMPIVGSIIYIIFYRHRMSKSEARLAEEIVNELDELSDEPRALAALALESQLACGKAMAVLSIDKTAEVYQNTSAKFYRLGEIMYEDMLEALRSAEKYIFLEYFIFEDGEMWQGIYELLLKKVREGVEVRLMYDDFGCMQTMPEDFGRMLVKDGIDAMPYAIMTARLTRAQNNRDHRKILVVDGRVGFTGGVNIADEYINKNGRLGHWKDGGIRLIGDAVLGLTTIFLTLWDINKGEKSDYPCYLIQDKCKESFTDGGYYLPFGSGPYPMYKRQSGKRAIIDIINQAKRYVYITSPYLIIDYDLTDAMVGAVERGVDVRLVLPSVPDKKFVKAMTKSSYPYLIKGGVKIYEYTPGFMHMKSLVADDEYAMIGTINLDYRSLVHHYEDAVWIYRSPVVTDIRDDILASISVSHRMTEKESRLNLFEWITKCALRLFAPLL